MQVKWQCESNGFFEFKGVHGVGPQGDRKLPLFEARSTQSSVSVTLGLVPIELLIHLVDPFEGHGQGGVQKVTLF